MKKFLFTLFTLLSACIVHGQYTPSETRYDWSGLANSITDSSKSNYDKAHDIYNWITRNIAYDTSYSIRTADATYENKRGVCQGYSELFYRLAEAVGLRTEVVTGKSKDDKGYIDPKGHAWIFAYVDDNSGILIDPTWGAGHVDNGVFTFAPTEVWFHVPADWMLFTHFPDEPSFQLKSTPLGMNDFSRLPFLRPQLRQYGYDAAQIIDDSLNGKNTALPEFYCSVIDRSASAVNIPKEKNLRVGKEYMFALRPVSGARFVIINGGEWEREFSEQDGVTGIWFMPHTAGELSLNLIEPDGSATSMIVYNVPQATAADIAALEQKKPALSPVLKKLKNYNRKDIEERGIDAAKLLHVVKNDGIEELPVFYNVPCRMVDIPFNGVLTAGNTYKLRFKPQQGVDFALINGQTWIRDWHQDPATGIVTITATPAPGKLSLAVKQNNNTTSYDYIMEYRVK